MKAAKGCRSMQVVFESRTPFNERRRAVAACRSLLLGTYDRCRARCELTCKSPKMTSNFNIYITRYPQDPFIVYTSNMWAILNLRSLFTILSSAVEDLVYLRPAVAVVLAFVGGKLGGEFFGYNVSIEESLAVITGLLGAGIGFSLLERRRSA